MSRPVACPHCQTPCQIPETAAGQVLRCPRCQGQFRAPEAGVLLALPYRNDRVVIYRLSLKQ
jgi:hypothetical protein